MCWQVSRWVGDQPIPALECFCHFWGLDRRETLTTLPRGYEVLPLAHDKLRIPEKGHLDSRQYPFLEVGQPKAEP